MKTIAAACAALALTAGVAQAEATISPLCESIGEFTLAIFEARHEGAALADVTKEALAETDDKDFQAAFSEVITAVYALELATEEEAAVNQAVDFAAEVVVGCEAG